MGINTSSRNFIYLYTFTIDELRQRQLDRYTAKHAFRYIKFRNTYCMLKNLSVLDLSNIKDLVDFKNINFNFIDDFKHLVKLNLSNNNITHMPVLSSRALKVIDLSYNNITNHTNSFNYAFYSCQPTILNLSYNQLNQFRCTNVTFYKIILTGNNIIIFDCFYKIYIN